ncbi:MAG: hypothetical protein LM577_06830 [Thermoproteaceae archaeon]|jgi:hypothetical protein|nr:hypothetical protein [Thermoproteaceae archaeon]
MASTGEGNGGPVQGPECPEGVSSARDFVRAAVRQLLERRGGCAKRDALIAEVYELSARCGVLRNYRSVRTMVGDALEELGVLRDGARVCLPAADPLAHFMRAVVEVNSAVTPAEFCERSRECVRAAIQAGHPEYYFLCAWLLSPRAFPKRPWSSWSWCRDVRVLCVGSVEDLAAILQHDHDLSCTYFVLPFSDSREYRQLFELFRSRAQSEIIVLEPNVDVERLIKEVPGAREELERMIEEAAVNRTLQVLKRVITERAFYKLVERLIEMQERQNTVRQ